MKKKNRYLIFQFIFIEMVLIMISGCKKDNTADDSKDKKTITYGSMSDLDGNTYKTLTLGTQTWMAEDLRTTKFNDGTAIPNVTSANLWDSLTTAAFCTYNNTLNTDTINTCGRLYNWYAVNSGKLCPSGWHIPDDQEWKTLENYLIANKFSYDSLTTDNMIGKSMASTTGWLTSLNYASIGNDESVNNRSGLTCVPAGARLGGANFGDFGVVNYLWSSSEANALWANCRYLAYDNNSLGTFTSYKFFGFSVRCVKDK